METSQVTVLAEKYRTQIEVFTKEFQNITINPATPKSEDLQVKWGMIFNTLKEIISEYKGLLKTMDALGIPVDEDDKELMNKDTQGVFLDDKNEVKYDDIILKDSTEVLKRQLGLSNNGTTPSGLIIPPQ